jgi:hypothetical protein
LKRETRELLLSAAFAVWGFTIALASMSVLRRPAPPDQTGGAAKLLNFDAHGPMRWMLALIVLPALVSLALRPVARLLAGTRVPGRVVGSDPITLPGAREPRRWAFVTAMVAPLVTLWLVTVHITLWHALIPCALALLLATLLRHRDLRFSRHDAILVLVFLTTTLAIIDIVDLTAYNAAALAMLLVLILRIAVTYIDSPLPPAFAFVIAPLGTILMTGFFARDQRYFGWHALALVVVTPFLLRRFLRNRRRAFVALSLVVYPLALLAYWNSMTVLTAEGKPRVNFFEDGHALLPASEYLRGELPYRDILPAHGLFEDGFFDYLFFLTGDESIGGRAKAREVVGMLMAVALYFLARAVTGSPHAGMLAVLLAIMMGTFAPTIRMLPAFVTLAFLASAVRWRNPRWFGYAAFGTVVAGAMSLDFGAYAFLTLLIALIRTRTGWRHAAIGIAAGVVPLFLGFLIFGILDDFVYGTFVEVLGVGPAYVLGFFSAPQPLQVRRYFPEVLGAAIDAHVFHYIGWCVLTVFVGTTITRRWSRRFEPLLMLAAFAVLTGISYAERFHLYFGMPLAVSLAWVIFRLARKRSALAIPAFVAALVMANPTTHLSVLGYNRGLRKQAEEFVEVRDVPRARGAYWNRKDVAALDSVRRYVASRMQPDETWLDFSNSALYYYVLNRDCPIRQYEVAFIQSEKDQREVIRILQTNRKIVSILVAPTAHGRFTVDIPNAWRAPLVHQYILENFQPDFEEGEVAFWRRR